MENVLLIELPSLADDIHVKTWEVSQNADLIIQEFLKVYKVLQTIRVDYTGNKYLKINENW